MQEIMKLNVEKKANLAEHAFYRWVEESPVEPEDKLLFAPILANFVMNFRDINKWFLRFPEPKNEFEEIINGNTREDETHSRLFIEDWRKLQLDAKLGWRAGDAIWWLFLAVDTEPFRRYGMEFSQMSVVDGGDALVRFAHSEAGEACGNAFFDVLSKTATAAQAKTGVQYRYFGVHHLDRELGHVLESEGVFENQPLDAAQRKKSLALASQMFDIFEGMHDRFLRFAEDYVARGVWPRRQKGEAAPVVAERTKPAPVRSAPEDMTPLHAQVQRVLDERKARTAQHPFFSWLREENGIPAKQKLQRFIPMWVMDIMGYRDLNRYGMRYAVASTPQERAINEWVDALETHSPLFLNDWDALSMDEVVGWTAGQTFKFLFLDPQMDVHRRNIATFIKLAFAHTKPVQRFWLIEALEASGEAFFESTRALATRVEAESGMRLDYLANRHDVVQPGREAQREGADLGAFKRAPIDAADRDIVVGMVETVFDAVDEQLQISLEVARSNKFAVG